MPRTNKHRKVFMLGDVVKYNESLRTPEEIIRSNVKPDDKGIVTGINEWVDGYSYYIQWFQQIIDTICTDYYRLILCEGMKNSEICDKCRFRLECWTTRERVLARATMRLNMARI